MSKWQLAILAVSWLLSLTTVAAAIASRRRGDPSAFTRLLWIAATVLAALPPLLWITFEVLPAPLGRAVQVILGLGLAITMWKVFRSTADGPPGVARAGASRLALFAGALLMSAAVVIGAFFRETGTVLVVVGIAVMLLADLLPGRPRRTEVRRS